MHSSNNSSLRTTAVMSWQPLVNMKESHEKSQLQPRGAKLSGRELAEARMTWLLGEGDDMLANLFRGLKLNREGSGKESRRRVFVRREFQPRSLAEARRQRERRAATRC